MTGPDLETGGLPKAEQETPMQKFLAKKYTTFTELIADLELLKTQVVDFQTEHGPRSVETQLKNVLNMAVQYLQLPPDAPTPPVPSIVVLEKFGITPILGKKIIEML